MNTEFDIKSSKETFHFTVSELREILKSLPPQLPVMGSNGECGFEIGI